MADVATPPAPAKVDAGAPVEEKKKGSEKPEKPDKDVYEASLKKAEKELDEAKTKLNAIKAKLDLAQPTSKDSPTATKRAGLLSELKEIREKQGAGKAGRNKLFDSIKKEDATLKELIAQQKIARSRVSYKSAEDVDREIARLEKQIDTGTMKIVDEKKAFAEIAGLRKQKKGFAGFDDAQKAIDAKKAHLKELRDTLDDPESKALSDKYTKVQTELDAIRAEQDEVFKNLNGLRDERKKLQDIQQAKFQAAKKIKDDFFQQNRAVQKWEYESRQKARERKKAEDAKYQQEKRKERAQQVLAEASDKAYLDEIRRAESLLRYFDPSYSSEKAPLQAPSQFTATAQRKVDDSGIKGVRVVKKDEEDYFAGTGGKKNKNKKKAAASEAPAAEKKYNCPPSVMEDCAAMGIEPPMSASDIASVREKVKAKLDHWKADQEAQTEKNIAKAKKEIERLEAEETAASAPGTPTTATPHANGETKATASVDEGGSVKNEVDLLKSASADAAADLKGATAEDKE